MSKPDSCTGHCVISGVLEDSCFTCGASAEDLGNMGGDEYSGNSLNLHKNLEI